jgi:hypothetical protein
VSTFSDIRCPHEIYDGQMNQRCILNEGHEGQCIPADRDPRSLASEEILARPPIKNVDDFLADVLGEE